jgi:hypothetical protein
MYVLSIFSRNIVQMQMLAYIRIELRSSFNWRGRLHSRTTTSYILPPSRNDQRRRGVKDTDTPTVCSLYTAAGTQPPHPPALLGTAAAAAPRGGRGTPPSRRPTSCSPNTELRAGWIWPVRGEKGRGEICGRCGRPCYTRRHLNDHREGGGAAPLW